MSTDHSKDTLTQRLGVLTRRETEARILIPVVEAMAEAFGKEEVHEVLRKTVVEIARKQGRELAADFGDNPAAFLETLKFWTQDDALEIDVRRDDGRYLDFDVKRCRYAEMYRALGVPELGRLLSCNRDFALIEGFNESASLTREQTIMEGAPCCTFRYDFGALTDEEPR
ncbi:hypothetical protein GR183_04185 [Stappia sp. GBMRC 2046]|uniref:L-2-amino-thiazoline-4-carboxylic acid hydrolase n=1 Tax=Stappia sediminis TaxID=2692190 RepID=A0A7X3LS38_9HYPH|nr:L-2-amino-thiazoline-4-carboxylic acid hydrolase [Stappia sediminis]MXN64092.1 hypothetical protein [Stappia sediminis]